MVKEPAGRRPRNRILVPLLCLALLCVTARADDLVFPGLGSATGTASPGSGVYLAEFGGTLLIGAALALPAVALVSPVLTLVKRGLMRFGLVSGAPGPSSSVLLTAFGYTAGCIAGEGFLASRHGHQGNVYWTAGATTAAPGLATWGALELGLGQTTLERTELAGCIALALSVPATAVLVNHLTWRPGAYPLPYGTRLSGPSLAVGYEVRSETGRIRCLDLRLLTLRI